MRFLRTFLLASAGFALLDLAVRPPRQPAAPAPPLVVSVLDLRGDLDDGAAARDGSPRAGRDASRRLCLCDGCSARRSVQRA